MTSEILRYFISSQTMVWGQVTELVRTLLLVSKRCETLSADIPWLLQSWRKNSYDYLHGNFTLLCLLKSLLGRKGRMIRHPWPRWMSPCLSCTSLSTLLRRSLVRRRGSPGLFCYSPFSQILGGVKYLGDGGRLPGLETLVVQPS